MKLASIAEAQPNLSKLFSSTFIRRNDVPKNYTVSQQMFLSCQVFVDFRTVNHGVMILPLHKSCKNSTAGITSTPFSNRRYLSSETILLYIANDVVFAR